jgi:hypothetical protein
MKRTRSNRRFLLDILLVLLIASGCKPQLDSTDYHERLRAVQALELTNQEVLISVAIGDADSYVSCAAVSKVIGQADIARIAIETKSDRVGVAALEKLTNQTLLTKVALEAIKDGHQETSRHAVEKITDQETLSKLVLPSVDWRVRVAAAKSLKDAGLLARIATKDECKDVQLAAVEALKDDKDVLVRLAIQAQDPVSSFPHMPDDGACAAVSKLDDQILLEKIASAAKSKWVREAAIKKLTNQVILATLALTHSDVEAVISRLIDEELLTKLATECGDWYVRKMAVGKITNQDLLAKIALNDTNLYVRKMAVGKITNQDLLAKIALNDPSLVVRLEAVGKVTDRAVLSKILATAKNELYFLTDPILSAAYRRMAEFSVKDITSQTNLAEMALTDRDWAVRLAAASKLSDEIMLTYVLAQTTDADVCNAIAMRICYKLIERGDATLIPMLIRVLDFAGNTDVAETYLNCGQPELQSAAKSWATRHGYEIQSRSDPSSVIYWGSKRR